MGTASSHHATIAADLATVSDAWQGRNHCPILLVNASAIRWARWSASVLLFWTCALEGILGGGCNLQCGVRSGRMMWCNGRPNSKIDPQLVDWWGKSTMLKNFAFQYFRVFTVELVVLLRKKLPVMQVHLHISRPGDLSVPADLLWAYCCWICKWSLPLLCILLVGRYTELDVVSYTSLHCLRLLADYLCWIARYMELHVIWYTIPAAITWVLLVDYP